MNITIERKIQPVEVFASNPVPVDDYQQNCEVYIDGERAPDFVEKAILFYLDVNGALYVRHMEMRRKKEWGKE